MNHNDLIALMNTGEVPMKIITEQGEKKSAGSPVAPAALHVSPAVPWQLTISVWEAVVTWCQGAEGVIYGLICIYIYTVLYIYKYHIYIYILCVYIYDMYTYVYVYIYTYG